MMNEMMNEIYSSHRHFLHRIRILGAQKPSKLASMRLTGGEWKGEVDAELGEGGEVTEGAVWVVQPPGIRYPTPVHQQRNDLIPRPTFSLTHSVRRPERWC